MASAPADIKDTERRDQRQSLASQLREHAVQRLREQRRVGSIERHGRADLEHVVERAVGAREHAFLAKAVDHVVGLFRRRPTGAAIAHELHADEKAAPAHVAHHRVAILNPPQVGILGLHAIKDRPVAVNGQVVIRPMMYTALTYDHRIVDGSEAVRFLVKIKELIEDPGALLIE